MGFSAFFLKKLSFSESLFRLFQQMKILNLFLIFCVFPVEALKIRFPDEELAFESVLPLMDPPQMVLNRNVPLKFRVELGLGLGVALDEPFYFPFYPQAMLAFHLTEVHAIGVTGASFLAKRSKGGDKLSAGKGLNSGQKFDPLKAPYPQMMAFVTYQYAPYYGKISLAKNWVMNLSIYGFAGPGLIVTDQNDQLIAGNFGIGQKLYFNKWLGIRGDLAVYGYYGPATAKLKLNDDVEEVQYKKMKSEEKGLIINFVANVGVIFLI